MFTNITAAAKWTCLEPSCFFIKSPLGNLKILTMLDIYNLYLLLMPELLEVLAATCTSIQVRTSRIRCVLVSYQDPFCQNVSQNLTKIYVRPCRYDKKWRYVV